VTIGYFIAKVMLEKYPLAKGQKYVWIGSPAKCGDDAIQILMDLTPGKRSCYIKELGPDQKKAISVEEPLNNVMGILVIWDNAQNKGKGVVFKYNWGRVCELTGIKYSDFMPKGGYANPVFWTTRLKSNIAVIPYFDTPTEFVRVAKEVEVTPEMYVQMIGAGVNPYQTIGLTKP
jgi:formylmethanofuran dehydrogenase subunit E-like metal-binding protein